MWTQGSAEKKEVIMMEIKIHAINYDYGVVNDVYENTHGIFDEVHLMPDTHRGATVPVGFVAKIDMEKGIIPEIVGTDIGCSIAVYEIPKLDIENIDWKALHEHIKKHIPSGQKVNQDTRPFDFSQLRMKADKSLLEYYAKALGTLGGGNHFIEINAGKEKDYVIIHSGSRKFGLDVCKYYTRMLSFDLESYKKELESIEPKEREKAVPKLKAKYNSLKNVLKGKPARDYLNDMEIAQRFASENRKIMMANMLKFFGMSFEEKNYWESMHNYIDFDDMTVRKGATPARSGQRLVVPINMRDGSIIATGKGNPDWLCSAPHGAGRVMSRSRAKENIRLSEYIDEMRSVISYSVSRNTLDEAPQAYRGIDEIIEATKDTMEILEIVRPIFNFKGLQ